MNALVAGKIALALLLCAATVTVAVRQGDLARRLDAVEAARPDAEAAPAPGGGAEEKIALLSGRLEKADQERQLALSEVRAEVQKVWAELMRSPEGASAAADGDRFVERPGFEDAVRAAVDRYAVEQKFRDAVRKAVGPLVPKKPKFAELARALELRPPQAERLGADVREIQRELLEVLQVPRDDGVAPLEEIVQAEQYAPGDPKRGEVFVRLMKLKIPDTDETYFERAVTLVQRVKEGTKSYLDTGQRDTLDTLDLDWFGIKMD